MANLAELYRDMDAKYEIMRSKLSIEYLREDYRQNRFRLMSNLNGEMQQLSRISLSVLYNGSAVEDYSCLHMDKIESNVRMTLEELSKIRAELIDLILKLDVEDAFFDDGTSMNELYLKLKSIGNIGPVAESDGVVFSDFSDIDCVKNYYTLSTGIETSKKLSCYDTKKMFNVPMRCTCVDCHLECMSMYRERKIKIYKEEDIPF